VIIGSFILNSSRLVRLAPVDLVIVAFYFVLVLDIGMPGKERMV